MDNRAIKEKGGRGNVIVSHGRKEGGHGKITDEE